MSAESIKKKIEVTPAMIEAGTRALANYDPVHWSDDESAIVLAEVYREMESHRPKSKQ